MNMNQNYNPNNNGYPPPTFFCFSAVLQRSEDKKKQSEASLGIAKGWDRIPCVHAAPHKSTPTYSRVKIRGRAAISAVKASASA